MPSDTIALEERGRVEIAPLSKLPHVMFFGGGVVIKLGDETIGAIGASGAQEPSWMTPARVLDWTKFEIG